MSKLAVVRDSNAIQPTNDPPKEKQGEIKRLRSMLKRLDFLLQTTTDATQKAEIIQLIEDTKASLAEAEQRHRETNTQLAAPTGRDKNEIHGHVLPGAVVGNGSANFEGPVAGRDVKTGHIIIEQANTVILDGEQTAKSEKVGLAERAYLLWLKEKASRVPLGKLDMQMAMPAQATPDIQLNEIYVPLDTVHTQRVTRRDKMNYERVPIPVLSEINTHKRLMILGDPGSGKTSLLNYITLCLIGARFFPEKGFLERLNVPKEDQRRAVNWRAGALIPLRIELREFANDIPKNTKKGTPQLVLNHIKGQLESNNLGDFSSDLMKALRNGQCLVMFDGMDEIAESKQRRIVRDAIQNFADAHRDCRFIATCRVLSYNHRDWQLSSFPPIKLSPLSESSIDLFIDKWYGALAHHGHVEKALAKTRAKELRAAAVHLHDLAQNPMLLTVMSVVHTYKGTLPRERARLYDDCVQLLLWEWQRTKQLGPQAWEPGIAELLETRNERLFNGLCEVAFQAHRAQVKQKNNTADIPKSDILRVLQRYLDGDWGKAQRFCEYVEERAGLLIGRGTNEKDEPIYAFPHRGFQEFLAARHIVVSRDFDRNVVRLAAEGDIWHEVLLLAIGHLVFNNLDIYQPLNAINLLCKPEPPKDPAGWRAVWWAAEMLAIVDRPVAEQDEYVGKTLVPRLMEQLVKLVTEGHLTPHERAQAADMLGWLGDPRPGVCTDEPEMIRIEGGPFEMGPDDNRKKVTLKPFHIARYPVTNAQFRAFLADPDYDTERYWTHAGLEWRKRAGNVSGYVDDPWLGLDNRPVVGITWHEAVAFVNWLRYRKRKPYRLLTEEEWERAAAGLERRKFPFGTRASADSINTREAGIGQTTAVGIFPKDCTPEGVYDMTGNVWEWCSSLAQMNGNHASGDKENINAPGPRILRGSSHENSRKESHCTQRRPAEPHARVSIIGFRVGMDG